MRKILLLWPALVACSLVQSVASSAVERPNFLSAGAATAEAIKSGLAEVKIDGTLNAAGATLPVKVARTVELKRATGSAGP